MVILFKHFASFLKKKKKNDVEQKKKKKKEKTIKTFKRFNDTILYEVKK